MRNESHMNYLRRKTADEAELWAANRIEELEFSWAGCSQQLKDACADLSEVERERDALQAHIAQLRGYLTRILEYWTQDANNQELFDMLCHIEETVKAELAANPEQSLARLRNEVREECAALCEDAEPVFDGYGYQCAKAILAMKESE